MSDEPSDHTLQPTALAHEAFVRMSSSDGYDCRSRAQFLSHAARAMRRTLIDYARRRRSAKRGGSAGQKISLETVAEPAIERDAYLVALDDALVELAALDGELVRIVELRFFGGLSIEETAHVLGVSPMTVKRRWRLARGWLHREIVKAG